MKRRVKNYINYLLDLILLLSIGFILVSSYILWFVLPRGIGYQSLKCNMQGYGISGTYYEALGWNRIAWIDVHNWASIALLAIILLHIILHWSWIVETTRRARSYIGKKVKKVTELYTAAVVLFILLLFESFSGFVIWLILPRGKMDYNAMRAGVGRTFWGLQRNIWCDLHSWIAVAILAMIIIHLILNWNWVVTTSKNILRRFSVGKQKPFGKAR